MKRISFFLLVLAGSATTIGCGKTADPQMKVVARPTVSAAQKSPTATAGATGATGSGLAMGPVSAFSGDDSGNAPAGCGTGGQKYQLYKDDDNNGTKGEGETTAVGSMQYLCTGQTGTDGADGLAGTNGTNGSTGTAGTNGTNGSTGAQGAGLVMGPLSAFSGNDGGSAPSGCSSGGQKFQLYKDDDNDGIKDAGETTLIGAVQYVCTGAIPQHVVGQRLDMMWGGQSYFDAGLTGAYFGVEKSDKYKLVRGATYSNVIVRSPRTSSTANGNFWVVFARNTTGRNWELTYGAKFLMPAAADGDTLQFRLSEALQTFGTATAPSNEDWYLGIVSANPTAGGFDGALNARFRVDHWAPSVGGIEHAVLNATGPLTVGRSITTTNFDEARGFHLAVATYESSIATLPDPSAPSVVEGRLNLNGSPTSQTDVLASSTLHYTVHTGNRIALWDLATSRWVVKSFSANGSMTLCLTSAGMGCTSNVASDVEAGFNYDVFGYLKDGVPNLILGPKWSANSARAAGEDVSRDQGVIIRMTGGVAAPQYRWLGIIRASANGQSEDSAMKRFVFNTYNKRQRYLKSVTTGGDPETIAGGSLTYQEQCSDQTVEFVSDGQVPVTHFGRTNIWNRAVSSVDYYYKVDSSNPGGITSGTSTALPNNGNATLEYSDISNFTVGYNILKHYTTASAAVSANSEVYCLIWSRISAQLEM